MYWRSTLPFRSLMEILVIRTCFLCPFFCLRPSTFPSSEDSWIMVPQQSLLSNFNFCQANRVIPPQYTSREAHSAAISVASCHLPFAHQSKCYPSLTPYKERFGRLSIFLFSLYGTFLFFQVLLPLPKLVYLSSHLSIGHILRQELEKSDSYKKINEATTKHYVNVLPCQALQLYIKITINLNAILLPKLC